MKYYQDISNEMKHGRVLGTSFAVKAMVALVVVVVLCAVFVVPAISNLGGFNKHSSESSNITAAQRAAAHDYALSRITNGAAASNPLGSIVDRTGSAGRVNGNVTGDYGRWGQGRIISSTGGSASSTSQQSSGSRTVSPGQNEGTLAKTIRTADGKRYTVKVVYDANAGIPAGSKLNIVEYVPEPLESNWKDDPAYKDRPYDTERFQNEFYLQQRANVVAKRLDVNNTDYVFYNKFLDLSITHDGETVELTKPVAITITTTDIYVEESDLIEMAMLVDGDDSIDERSIEEGRATSDGKIAEPIVVTNLTNTVESENGKSAADNNMVKLQFSSDELNEVALIGVVRAEDNEGAGSEGGEPAPEPAPELAPEPAPDFADPAAIPEGEPEEGFAPEDSDAPAEEPYEAPDVDEPSPVDVAADGSLDEGAASEGGDIVAAEPEEQQEGGNPAGREAAGDTIEPAASEQPAASELPAASEQVADTAENAEASESGECAMASAGAGEASETTAARGGIQAESHDVSGIAGAIAEAFDNTSAATAPGGRVALPDGSHASGSGKFVGDAETANTFEQGVNALLGTSVHTLTKQVSDIDGNSYSIEVTYGPNAGIGDGAKLFVRELLNIEYAMYLERASQVLDSDSLAYVRGFDIRIIDAQGNEIEPLTPVNVTISLGNTPAFDEANVLHFSGGDPDVIAPDVSTSRTESTFDFTTSSFSAYIIAGSVHERVLTASDGHAYKVTATYDYLAGIPADAELMVSELLPGDEAYDRYIDESASQLGVSRESLSLAKAFDIKLRDPRTGEEYQPSKAVNVSIELLDTPLYDDEDVDVVHFGSRIEVLDSEVKDGAVTFDTAGFSVYVIVDANGDVVTPRYTFVFHKEKIIEGGYNDDNLEQVGQPQIVKQGEKPIVPQLEGDSANEFDGWYAGTKAEGATIPTLEYHPYDFNSIDIEQDREIHLYAKYKQFVTVIFHEYALDASYPVTYTRRAELVGGSANVKISDVRATAYTKDATVYEFYGWADTNIDSNNNYIAPGEQSNDSLAPLKLVTDSNGCISVNGGDESKDLYALYKVSTGAEPGSEVARSYKLSFDVGTHTSSSVKSLTYTPTLPGDLPSEPIKSPLPVPQQGDVPDPDFQGWYLRVFDEADQVWRDKQITNNTGNITMYYERDEPQYEYNIVNTIDIYYNQIQLSANVTLHAKWATSNAAEVPYTVVIWRERPPYTESSNGKRYDYVQTIRESATVNADNPVSVPLTSKAYMDYHNATEGMFKNSVMIPRYTSHVITEDDIDNPPIINVYYDLRSTYTPADSGSYTLTFADSASEGGSVDIPAALTGLRYGEELADKLPANPSRKSPANREVYDFSGWYMDQDCTYRADLTTMTDHDITVYAGWSPKKFQVELNPNLETASQLPLTSSFETAYEDDPFDEPVVSDYSATYTYVGWYEQYADGTEASEPYDFTQHVDHDLTLKLHWKRQGKSFNLVYDAGDGTIDNGANTTATMQNLADHSTIVVDHSAKSNDGRLFLGWQMRSSASGRTGSIYTPGQMVILYDSDKIFDDTTSNVAVYFDAVYATPGTVTIEYHVNGATMQNGFDCGKVIEASGEGSSSGSSDALTKSIDSNKGIATISGIPNNSTFQLSDGSSGLTNAPGEFLGWSTDQNYVPGESSSPFYAKGTAVTYGVDINDPNPIVLYAVWDVKYTVTYHLNPPLKTGSTTERENAQFYSKDEEQWPDQTYTYTTSGETTYSQTVSPGTIIAEPPATLCIKDKVNPLFLYWSTDQNDTNWSKEYTFPQSAATNLDLYAIWGTPDPVNVHVVDSSNEALAEVASGTDGWTMPNNIAIGATATSLSGISHVTAPSNYDYAFATVAANANAITEESKAITELIYDRKKRSTCVRYEGESDYNPLTSGYGVYFIYYKEKELPIGYRTMDYIGDLEKVGTLEDIKTSDPLGTYNMTTAIENPLSSLGDASEYTYYSYAVGANGATGMAGVNYISPAVTSEGESPVLSIRNTWRGFEYTTDALDGDPGSVTWSKCGYDPQLFVVYFKDKPTIVKFREVTIGTESMKRKAEFSFDVKVRQPSLGGDIETVFDTSTEPYKLKDGDSRYAVVFYNTKQSAYIYPEIKRGFELNVTFSPEKEGQNSGEFQKPINDRPYWTYTPSSFTELSQVADRITVTFTYTQVSFPVEAHVALVDAVDTTSNAILRKDDLRSENETDYIIDLEKGSDDAKDLLSNLSSDKLFAGKEGTYKPGDYALGAILYGSAVDEGQKIDVKSMGVASVSCEGDGDDFKMIVKDSTGAQIGILDDSGETFLYYLYYPKPKVQFVKLSGDNTLTPLGSVTNDKKAVQLNEFTLSQGMSLEIPLSGFAVDQTAEDAFQMPATLDDGDFLSCLTYTSLGIGGSAVANTNDMYTQGWNQTNQYLQIEMRDNVLQYTIDGTHWHDLPLANDTGFTAPTIYAIYTDEGHDLQITKDVVVANEADEEFADSLSFTVTVSSPAIGKSTYTIQGVETLGKGDGYGVQFAAASGSEPGTITLTGVKQGTDVTIKGLERGTYTITESNNESCELIAKLGKIGETAEVKQVKNNASVDFTLNAPTKVELTNTLNVLCKVGDTVFHSIQSAVTHISELENHTGVIEMLKDLSMKSADAVTIPSGVNATLTTAKDGFNGAGSVSKILRTEGFTDAPMFVNNGTFTLENITLDGNNVSVGHPIIRQDEGTASLTIGDGAVVTKAKSTGNGGAVLAQGGTVTVDGGTLSDNSALSGGAIYRAFDYDNGASVIITGNSVLEGNTSTGTDGGGGAIYSFKPVTVSGSATFKNNKAEGNGGAIYAQGELTVSGIPAFTGNTSEQGYGGAIYAHNATIESGTMTKNEAKNGAALFVVTSATLGSNDPADASGVLLVTDNTTDGGLTRHSDTEFSFTGGAVGVSEPDAKLTIRGDVRITGNTYEFEADNNAANVYLGHDITSIINVDASGLASTANIGIYIPGSEADNDTDSLFNKLGKAGKRFGSYKTDGTTDGSSLNLINITNDRYPALKAMPGTDGAIIWEAPLKVEVRYLDSFTDDGNSNRGFPPTKTGTTIYETDSYTPPVREGETAVSEIASTLLASDVPAMAAFQAAHKTARFAYAFADGATEFGEYLTHVGWKNETNSWYFVKRNSNPSATSNPGLVYDIDKLIIYYTEPSYITIENNTTHVLTISDLKVLGRSAINSPSAVGYGYVDAANGAAKDDLLPITNADLSIPVKSSIRMMFPGASNSGYGLTGKFNGAMNDVKLTRSNSTREVILNSETANSGFNLPYTGDEDKDCRVASGPDGTIITFGDENPTYSIDFVTLDSYYKKQGGNTFTLYRKFDRENYQCVEPFTRGAESGGNVEVRATSDSRGNVKFAEVPDGVYYMKATSTASGYNNSMRDNPIGNPIENIYLVLVGKKALESWNEDSTVGELLQGFTQKDIEDQTTHITDNGEEKPQSAIFLIDSLKQDGGYRAVIPPDIKNYGILNTSNSKNIVVFKRVIENNDGTRTTSYKPVSDSTFEIVRPDGTVVASNLKSTSSGIFWVGRLRFGLYYLHETDVPEAAMMEDETEHWFTVLVDSAGAHDLTLSEAPKPYGES